jgi:crotonobetainyl-CoA:carnitine CoA-transferase CaiB-like acyl-CoA transferase
MPNALDGVRILDLSWGVAAPIGVLMLAEHGADVIKVEPPGGSPFRKQRGSYVWNRSRRSITLDLKKPEGKELFHRLLETADVLVESFRPGVMQRLGLDYETLEPRYPRLIYCSVPGWPSKSRYAQRPGYDALVQARSGQQYEQPGWRMGPIFLYTPQPSMASMYLVSIGILAALWAREETGRGQRVETSLFQGVLAYTTMLWQYVENTTPQYRSGMPKTYSPLSGHQSSIFQCGDGEWIHASPQAGLTPKKTQDEVLGLPPGPPPQQVPGLPPEERRRLQEEKMAAFKRFKRDDLVELFHENYLGAEAIVPMEEIYKHPQLIANNMVVQVNDPEMGPTTQIGVPMTLLETPGKVKGPQPLPGQHNREILVGELGYTEAHLQEFKDKGII